MSTSIFIKSYPPDYPWIAYCLRSIVKYARGFDETIVISPTKVQLPENDQENRFKNIIRGEHTPSYLWQQAIKVSADIWTDSEHIMYMDSDCILDRGFHAKELFRVVYEDANFKESQPMLLRRPWTNLGDAIQWKAPTEKALGIVSEYETMATHPIIYRRDTLIRFRKHLEKHTGVASTNQYILNSGTFSEFNAIGNFILHFEPENYCIVDCDPATDGYPRPIRQAWSYGGLDIRRQEWEGVCK